MTDTATLPDPPTNILTVGYCALTQADGDSADAPTGSEREY